MSQAAAHADPAPIGIGFYTVPEAARLLKIPALNIRRWLGGYTYHKNDQTIAMPPLWRPQLPAYDQHMELGFRDLIELRVIKGFAVVGLSAAVNFGLVRALTNYDSTLYKTSAVAAAAVAAALVAWFVSTRILRIGGPH